MTDVTQRHYLGGYQPSSSHLSAGSDWLTNSIVLPMIRSYFMSARNPQRTAVQPIGLVIVDSVWQSSTNDHVNIRERILWHNKLQHCNKLLNSLDLRPDWDGEDGRAPTKQDVDNAINFLDHIPPRGIMSARVAIAGDGEGGGDWRGGGICLEVGFNDGEISFFAERNGTESGAEMDFKDGIPEELKLLMSTYFSR